MIFQVLKIDFFSKLSQYMLLENENRISLFVQKLTFWKNQWEINGFVDYGNHHFQKNLDILIFPWFLAFSIAFEWFNTMFLLLSKGVFYVFNKFLL